MKNDFSFSRHDARVKAEAMQAFRKRKMRRSTSQITAFFLVLVTLFAYPSRPQKAKQSATLRVPAAPEHKRILTGPLPDVRAKPSSSPAAIELSDEQLLAAFPAGSCYIAEVDGKKRLVFRSEELRVKYFN